MRWTMKMSGPNGPLILMVHLILNFPFEFFSSEILCWGFPGLFLKNMDGNDVGILIDENSKKISDGG